MNCSVGNRIYDCDYITLYGCKYFCFYGHGFDASYYIVFVARKENVYNLVREKAKKKLVCISKKRPFVITLKATTIYANRSTESVVCTHITYVNVTLTQ